MRSVLRRGPLDGVKLDLSVEDMSRPLLMPATREAFDNNQPTSPDFAEYRITSDYEPEPFRGLYRVWAYVGNGVQVTAEEVPDQPELAP